MTDTMTSYPNEEAVVVPIDAPRDPSRPGKYLIKSPTNEPFRCEFLLVEHDYTIVLPPRSYIIINTKSNGMFQDTRIDDHVMYTLPGSNPADYYLEQYMASIDEISPHIILALRDHAEHRLVSAVLYPRDIEAVPMPSFVTPDGNKVSVTTKGMNVQTDTDATVSYAHYPDEAKMISNAIYRPNAPGSDCDLKSLPKQEWG
jgi:hypothetical protein